MVKSRCLFFNEVGSKKMVKRHFYSISAKHVIKNSLSQVDGRAKGDEMPDMYKAMERIGRGQMSVDFWFKSP